MSQDICAAAIGCIDGRAAIPTLQFLQNYLQVDHVDFIASVDPVQAFWQNKTAEIEAIKRQIAASLNMGRVKIIAVVAHYSDDKATATWDEHFTMISDCVREIAHWSREARVLGLWINERWQAEIIIDSWSAKTEAA